MARVRHHVPVADAAVLRRVAAPCGALAVALLAGACAAGASGPRVAAAALAGAGALTQVGTREARRERALLPLVCGVALAAVAALWVAFVAPVVPLGAPACLGDGTAGQLELPGALLAELAAAVSVLAGANGARGGTSWWRFVRHAPQLRTPLAVVLHLTALGSTAAALTAVAACHAAGARLIDAVAAGAVAAGVGAVAVVLAVRLVGLLTLSPASAEDATGVQLALVAADVRSVAQLRVLRVAHDELLVTALVGLPDGADVAGALMSARRHIQDFVPAAQHIYLQPFSVTQG
ncbi:hypothetical protein GCM10022255_076110 [Dactylosporangium darangshiense]|uniref:Cation diffusion facilitator family transporter n=1 Tax=Dactylosporangium darangshiense TaxID=579108 RepID=A0ABP8DKK5_9ACTN